MVRVVKDEQEVLLIEAYELADDPKPSLGKIISLIRAKELTANENGDGFYLVPSLDHFNDELGEWKKRNRWSPTSAYNVLPDGFVSVIGFCREHVAPDVGREKKLYDGKALPPRFSSYTREYLKAGDCSEAALVSGGIWAAPPTAIRSWLKARYGIYIR